MSFFEAEIPELPERSSQTPDRRCLYGGPMDGHWRIKGSSIDRVRSDADFVTVVEERTRLRRTGVRLVGCCPFHEEKAPSFSVNPAQKLYYCFGCGKGGDMIGFVRDTEGVDFVGAVEWLARRFRIPLSYSYE
jgi:DNA primase